MYKKNIEYSYLSSRSKLTRISQRNVCILITFFLLGLKVLTNSSIRHDKPVIIFLLKKKGHHQTSLQEEQNTSVRRLMISIV
jgi:hypothetical protein